MAFGIKTISPLVLVLVSVAFAQIPNIGRCPKYGMFQLLKSPRFANCIVDLFCCRSDTGFRSRKFLGQMVRNRKILYSYWSIIKMRGGRVWAPFRWQNICESWKYESIVSFVPRKNLPFSFWKWHTFIFISLILSTGVQRIVSGVMSVTGKNDEATFTEKYTGSPLNSETTIHVLGTDYDSYAVLWSCNGVAGPVGHTGKLLLLPIRGNRF